MFTRAKLMFGAGDQEESASTPFTLTALGTTNATRVKASPGVVTAIHCVNVAAAVRYLRFYDTAAVPTAGAGLPVRKFAIPGNAAGAGFVLAPLVGMKFLTGIGFTLTTGVADSDATALTANDVILTLEFI